MAVSLSTAARNAGVDAIVDLIDGGSGAGVLRIYSGSKPAGPGSSATGTLLLAYTLSDPAFGSASSGSASIDVTPALSTTGLAAGTAGYFRLLDSTEAAGTGLGVIDGTVTATGGGGDVTLSTTTVSIGLTVEVTSLSITLPASA